MIDPGVYELKKSPEYSNLELLHKIAREDKIKLSIDYPSDMNPYYKVSVYNFQVHQILMNLD